MVVVDDEVARRERRQLGQEGGGALALLAAADEPVAEHVLLGEDGDVRRGEAVVERQDHQRRLRLAAERFLPAVDELLGLEPVIVEQAGKPLARADAVAGEHDLVAALPKLADMVGDGFVDIGLLRALRSEIARRLDAEADDPARSQAPETAR